MLNWRELEAMETEDEEEDEAWNTLVERYGYKVRAKGDLDSIHPARNTAEATGICWLLAEWLEEEGEAFAADAREVYDNLSGDRGGRWDLMDNVDIGDGLEVGAAVLNGDVVYAEVWSDDRIVGYVSIN